MKKAKEYTTQDLLASSEALLEEMGVAEALVAASPSSEVEQKVSRDILKRFGFEEEDFPQDGYVEISVSTNEMEAMADFVAPVGDGNPLDVGDVSRFLEVKKVSYGVDWDAIKESLFRCNTDRIDLSNVTIARGKNPTMAVPEHLVIEQQLLRAEQKQPPEEKRIDLRETSPFMIVKKGEVLARLVPERKGEMGYTGAEKLCHTRERGFLS